MSHVDDCRKFIQCLSAHFDGDLDPELEVEFMMHYEHCERAQALVRTFERTIVLHRQTGTPTLPSEVHERLLVVIKECLNSGE